MKKIKYYINTYGCAANEKDSETMEELLTEKLFERTVRLNNADIILLNSCSVRQKAEDKVYGFGQKILELDKKPFVILTGCMIGSATGKRKRYELQYLQKKIPWVDVFLEQKDQNKIADILIRKFEKELKKDTSKNSGIKKKGYVNISSGCDNFCSYCVVPYARGEEKSRSKKTILQEIEAHLKNGITEILLLGQNVNSWGLSKQDKFTLRAGSNQKLPFADLLRTLHTDKRFEKLKKIEFLSSNPFDFTQDLINALTLPKMSNYLHIAVQSGDDEILKKMNRRHTVKEFEKLIKEIYKKIPDIEIGTDFIVGFPGETEEMFENTVKLCKKTKFCTAYISIYSERVGTTAQKKFTDDIPLKVKKQRHKKLTAIIKRYG